MAMADVPNWDSIIEGQDIDVYIEQSEDDDSGLHVSIAKAEIQKVWDNIVNNNQEGSLIHGVIKQRVKGGLIVDVGVEAFLPGSQVDLGPVRNLDDYIGKEEDFKILKINAERRNIVLSRREILEGKRDEQRDTLLGELEKGRGTQFAPEFVDILLNLIRTNVIDLNELYGIKPEDTAQATETAKAETGAEKAAEAPQETGNATAPVSGEGGKS